MSLGDADRICVTTFAEDGTATTSSEHVVRLGEDTVGIWTPHSTPWVDRLGHSHVVSVQAASGSGNGGLASFAEKCRNTASATVRFMPGTCASASTEAALMASMLPKCANKADLRFSPTPAISSSAERFIFFPRSLRW